MCRLWVWVPAGAEGKEEDALGKEARNQAKGGPESPSKFDASSEKGLKSKTMTVANPMNMVNKVTGQATGHDAAPLYFPGAKSAALRSHAGVKFIVWRVDSPEDVSDPIKILFKLDLANKVNPSSTLVIRRKQLGQGRLPTGSYRGWDGGLFRSYARPIPRRPRRK